MTPTWTAFMVGGTIGATVTLIVMMVIIEVALRGRW